MIEKFQNYICEFKIFDIYNCLNLFQTNIVHHALLDGTVTCCLYFVEVCQRRAWLTVCLFDPPVHLVQDNWNCPCTPFVLCTNTFIATRWSPLKLVTIKMLLFQVNGTWGLPNFVCDFYIAMDVTCSTSSIFNLVAISIDRWVDSGQ